MYTINKRKVMILKRYDGEYLFSAEYSFFQKIPGFLEEADTSVNFDVTHHRSTR